MRSARGSSSLEADCGGTVDGLGNVYSNADPTCARSSPAGMSRREGDGPSGRKALVAIGVPGWVTVCASGCLGDGMIMRQVNGEVPAHRD
jgi:hypothetical protein